ncbi:MAG: Hsp20/alpha crystallin family protein [Deltaproteobacteria bacterium]|nr:Hsp20/alpha crystallin family protein [Deltaproteobacteria bacterium]MBW2069673.1 Hsp20/alpha crystallin family protein [Deltaproteobacteria bacterium]
MADKELQVREKQQVQAEAEQTKPGPVFVPAVDIFESENEITLLADLPGVASDSISIDLTEGQLTISAEVEDQTADNERFLLKEYETGRFHREFSLSDRIDQSKISATMKDGVLRLVLPKVEKARPRKIEVKAG